MLLAAFIHNLWQTNCIHAIKNSLVQQVQSGGVRRGGPPGRTEALAHAQAVRAGRAEGFARQSPRASDLVGPC